MHSPLSFLLLLLLTFFSSSLALQQPVYPLSGALGPDKAPKPASIPSLGNERSPKASHHYYSEPKIQMAKRGPPAWIASWILPRPGAPVTEVSTAITTSTSLVFVTGTVGAGDTTLKTSTTRAGSEAQATTITTSATSIVVATSTVSPKTSSSTTPQLTTFTSTMTSVVVATQTVDPKTSP
ncbi:MAG: hypothetical protein Q9191_007919, partial [Dirinaria sp. TL-2023a]